MNTKSHRARLHYTVDRLVEDIILTSDEDLIKGLNTWGESVAELDERAKAAIGAAAKKAGRERLAAARAQVAQRRPSNDLNMGLNLSTARTIYNRVRSRKADMRETLAARNGSELSDQQMLDILKDLLALGAISSKDLEG